MSNMSVIIHIATLQSKGGYSRPATERIDQQTKF